MTADIYFQSAEQPCKPASIARVFDDMDQTADDAGKVQWAIQLAKEILALAEHANREGRRELRHQTSEPHIVLADASSWLEQLGFRTRIDRKAKLLIVRW